MQKDIALALDAARELHVPLPSAATADQMLTLARGLGYEHATSPRSIEVLAHADRQPDRLADMTNPEPASHEGSRHSWRAAARAAGPQGNERLTSFDGLVLLVLLASRGS